MTVANRIENMLPDTIADIDTLETLLSEPPASLVEAMKTIEGDVVILGVAGKMGPTLARMTKRASDLADAQGQGHGHRPRRVIGVARFSDASQEAALQAHGIETVRADLLDEAALDRLPDAPNVIFMAGRKFGSTGGESLTWAMNVHLPALVCRRYATSRIVAFSTGNVYGLTPVGSAGAAGAASATGSAGMAGAAGAAGAAGSSGASGSVETDTLRPVGEYAMSCLGRERMFEHFSVTHGTRVSIVRLNYAVEMRYGVIADLARRIAAGETIDVTMGYYNVIWQGDANAAAIASLAHASSPPFVFNLAGPEQLSVRATCEELARLMGRTVTFTGREATDALLSDGTRGWAHFGRPRVDASRVIAWVADWVSRGGASLDKPTHFESRDGKF
jgi:nucleoside-diphosphate-sugar epimerase